jgi:Skp family chaperone for outer membrane proteins
MKTKFNPFIPLLAASLAILALAGCSKGEREEMADDTKAAYQDAKDKVGEGWDRLKGYTYERRQDFQAEFNTKQAEVEAEVSELKAEYSEAEASASRKAAMEDLQNAELNYKEKLSAVGRASSATWDAARDDVIAAWDELQASIARARSAD